MLVDGSAGEMAEALSGLLADEERLGAMSAAAPAWVRGRYSRQRMIDDYENYFRSLGAGRRGVAG
jgi:glycosyltransferase involved in cell wall biosynthesis